MRWVIATATLAMVGTITASARADEPDAAPSPTSPEPVVAPAGTGFYPTATYANNDVRPRPADAELEDDCDPNEPRTRVDPRCREVEVERSTSMNSPALVVVGGVLTVVGVLGIAGGVALYGHESASTSTGTSIDCRAGTSGIGCEDPTIDTSGAEDVFFKVAGVGTLLVSGAVAITGVTLVVVGAVPTDDEPAPRASFSVAPTRVSFAATF